MNEHQDEPFVHDTTALRGSLLGRKTSIGLTSLSLFSAHMLQPASAETQSANSTTSAPAHKKPVYVRGDYGYQRLWVKGPEYSMPGEQYTFRYRFQTVKKIGKLTIDCANSKDKVIKKPKTGKNYRWTRAITAPTDVVKWDGVADECWVKPAKEKGISVQTSLYTAYFPNDILTQAREAAKQPGT